MHNYLFIYKIPNFLKHKENLINLINKIPKNTLDTISHTDWNLPTSMHREYLEYFKNNLADDYVKSFCKHFKINNYTFNNLWFQVYSKGDYHGIHTHSKTHFTNVLYIKLPSKNLKTKVISLFEEELNFEAQEGSIVSFPAFYSHESPVNKTEEDKIIISFNSNIERG
jgi:hypothetical protein